MTPPLIPDGDILAVLEERAYKTKELAKLFSVGAAFMRSALCRMENKGVVEWNGQRRGWQLAPVVAPVVLPPPTQLRSAGVELESVWDGRSSLDRFNPTCDPDRSYGIGQSMSGLHTYSSTARRV